MDFVLDEDTDFSVEMDYETGESVVYATKDGNKELYDDRGNLFIALRNVAVNMFPNTAFRGADYIYNQGEVNYGKIRKTNNGNTIFCDI